MRVTKPHEIVHAVRWSDGKCVILDQTQIPGDEVYDAYGDYREVVESIKRLAVRGAPAIGIAGAYACALAVRNGADLDKAFNEIENARPTAVNLRWAVNRQRKQLKGQQTRDALFEVLLAEAEKIREDDIHNNRLMAEFGAKAIPSGAVLTCCNTGDLATGGVGTALGVIRRAWELGKLTHVYACETRPVLQGLRLTTWELERSQIPYTVICDNMAAILMRDGKVQSIITGADRIAANGDSANKVGTYGLAVLAKHHQVPFFIAAPTSTFDLSIQTGKEIPIEERNVEEIVGVLGKNQPKFAMKVFNPSFDVTQRELINSIFCERGVIHKPSTESVMKVIHNG